MARKRGGDTETPWWRTLPAILTAAATFIGSAAAVLALFIEPGGGAGTDGSPGTGLAPRPSSSDVIATSTVRLDGRTPDPIRRREANVGDLVADAILFATNLDAEARGAPHADLALINGGAIRLNSILAPGDLTDSDLRTMVPFPDRVVTVPAVSREELKALLEHAYARLPATTEAGRFAHVAGMAVRIDTRRRARDAAAGVVGGRVRGVELVDGTRIVVDGRVRPGPPVDVATGAFLANGGDEYPFSRGDAIPARMGYPEALMAYLTASEARGGLAGRVSAARYPDGGEGRITISPPLPTLR